MRHHCPTCGHRLTGFGYTCGCSHVWTESRFDDFGFDVTDGDFVVELGDGIGIDMRTGQLEEEIAPGVDVPLGDMFGGGW